jgi:hypothetical protein
LRVFAKPKNIVIPISKKTIPSGIGVNIHRIPNKTKPKPIIYLTNNGRFMIF